MNFLSPRSPTGDCRASVVVDACCVRDIAAGEGWIVCGVIEGVFTNRTFLRWFTGDDWASWEDGTRDRQRAHRQTEVRWDLYYIYIYIYIEREGLTPDKHSNRVNPQLTHLQAALRSYHHDIYIIVDTDMWPTSRAACELASWGALISSLYIYIYIVLYTDMWPTWQATCALGSWGALISSWYISISIYAYVSTYICIYTYVYIYVCTYIYIYIYKGLICSTRDRQRAHWEAEVRLYHHNIYK